jgi:hypothetical protein
MTPQCELTARLSALVAKADAADGSVASVTALMQPLQACCSAVQCAEPDDIAESKAVHQLLQVAVLPLRVIANGVAHKDVPAALTTLAMTAMTVAVRLPANQPPQLPTGACA